MSLVATYVKADDGKWYADPVLGTESWFICFDEPELVAMKFFYSGCDPTQDILKNIPFRITGKGNSGGRCYPPLYKGFRDSLCWWLEKTGPIPADLILKHNGVFDKKPDKAGVYYT